MRVKKIGLLKISLNLSPSLEWTSASIDLTVIKIEANMRYLHHC